MEAVGVVPRATLQASVEAYTTADEHFLSEAKEMEAVGVEFERARFSNLLMARDFWC